MISFTVGLLLMAIVASAIYASLWLLTWCTQDQNEPPILANSVPFISPLVGIFRHRTNFMVQLRDQNHSVPIYTLRLPWSRIYVISAPSIVPLVQRQKRLIAFEPVPARAAANIMGVSPAGVEVIGRNCTGDDAYFGTFLKATYPALAPGTALDAINRAAVDALATSMDRLEGQAAEGNCTVDLWEWVRHEILVATTDATYGPGNPFRDPANEMAWHEFEQGIMLQMVQAHMLFPRGRSSLQARESLVQAFARYLAQGCHQTPLCLNLALVQARYQHNVAHGLSLDDMARTEIGQVAASLSNTMPAAFWMLWHVLTDPIVLADCRAELERLVTVDPESNICTIDLAPLANRQTCPVLTSTWYEVLRFNHVGISARVVMQDTLVDGYLLKKDSTVMIVSPVMHTDLSVWGLSAREFAHRRFLHSQSQSKQVQKSPTHQHHHHNPEKSPANRIFGGGSSLCPGRHFASQEVLSFLALTIVRFDVRPTNGQHWVLPEKDIPLPTSLPIPNAGPRGLNVDIIPRHPERTWRVIFSDASKK